MYGLKATDLERKKHNEVIKDIVRQQIKLIDSQILTAHSAGFSSIVYDLPITFNIANLSKEDAQIIIYTDLIKIYLSKPPDGKGFDDVKIVNGLKPKLLIRWRNGLDTQEKRERLVYLKKFTTHKQE